MKQNNLEIQFLRRQTSPFLLIVWFFLSVASTLAPALVLANNNLQENNLQKNDLQGNDLQVKSPQLKQQQLELLRQEIKTLKASLNKQQSKKNQLEQSLKQAELTIADTARQLYSTQQHINKLKLKLTKLDATLQEHDSQLQQHQQLLSSQLRASYKTGRQEYIKLLLNQQDPATVSRIISYYDYFNQARSEEIARVNTLLQQIAVQKQSMASTRLEFEQQLRQQKKDKHFLELKQLERNDLLLQIEKDIISDDQKLQTLQTNEKNLLLLIEKLKKAQIEITNLPTEKPFYKQKGKLYWPVRGKVIKLYDRWRSMGKVKWQGVIITAKAGTPVFSVSHGRIAYADWLRGYGLLTIIDHGNGYMSLYGHNQTLLKEEGDWVDEGDVIATVGISGGFSKPGLYFEVRHNGKASNPARWCKKLRH
jgi:septal ring factor EnvC (AmiA/AmiB activator)